MRLAQARPNEGNAGGRGPTDRMYVYTHALASDCQVPMVLVKCQWSWSSANGPGQVLMVLVDANGPGQVSMVLVDANGPG